MFRKLTALLALVFFALGTVMPESVLDGHAHAVFATGNASGDAAAELRGLDDGHTDAACSGNACELPDPVALCVALAGNCNGEAVTRPDTWTALFPAGAALQWRPGRNSLSGGLSPKTEIPPPRI